MCWSSPLGKRLTKNYERRRETLTNGHRITGFIPLGLCRGRRSWLTTSFQRSNPSRVFFINRPNLRALWHY
jgi:hypothetical protein